MKSFLCLINEGYPPHSGTMWHGSFSNDLRGGTSGLHLGTKEAATQALHARIGHPVEGTWDGNREYKNTLLAGQKTMKEKGMSITGRNVRAPNHDYYHHEHPEGLLRYSNGDLADTSSKPSIRPFKIIGKMSNTTSNPHDDFKANGYMKASIKKGNARNGYYYRNVGEDAGSISAVVPNEKHIRSIE